MTPVRKSVERSDETSARSVRSGRGTLTDLEAAASRAAMACSSAIERTRGSTIALSRVSDGLKEHLKEAPVRGNCGFRYVDRDREVGLGFGDDTNVGLGEVGTGADWHVSIPRRRPGRRGEGAPRL